MKTLAQVHREMMIYAKEIVDLEEGESPKEWVETYIDALEEEGRIITVNGKKYVMD